MKPPATSRLQREIKQKKPFRSVSQEAVLALFRTTDILKRHFSSVVEDFGITLQQYNVLRILRGAEPDGLPALDIAERMIERSPGITRMLDRLERREWVRRERSAHDRRQVICRITRPGLKLLARMDGPLNRADDVLRDLPRQELRDLIATLDKIRAGCSGSRC